MAAFSASLLLLPASPLPLQRASLWSAYQITFETVLKSLRPVDDKSISQLEIAVTSDAWLSTHSSRAELFQTAQQVLEEVYTLICVVAAQNDIDLDLPGGVDVRLYFVGFGANHLNPTSEGKRWLDGPLVDALTFVRAKRVYHTVYVPDGAEGNQVLDNYLALLQQNQLQEPTVQRVPCGPLPTSTNTPLRSDIPDAAHMHKKVIVGGTFDHLHIGHKLLLTALVFVGEPGDSQDRREITVGITGDELLVNKKHASFVESWDVRQQRTAEFVESVLVFHPDVLRIRTIENLDKPGPNGKVVKVKYDDAVTVNYTRISDPYGPTITDQNISALVISKETRAGGKAVNDKRVEQGWAPLEVFEVDVLDAGGQDVSSESKDEEKTTFESKISSTEVRKRLEMKAASADG